MQKTRWPIDLLIVDETSMLDLLLANHLLKALTPGMRLLAGGRRGPVAVGRRR